MAIACPKRGLTLWLPVASSVCTWCLQESRGPKALPTARGSKHFCGFVCMGIIAYTQMHSQTVSPCMIECTRDPAHPDTQPNVALLQSVNPLNLQVTRIVSCYVSIADLNVCVLRREVDCVERCTHREITISRRLSVLKPHTSSTEWNFPKD